MWLAGTLERKEARKSGVMRLPLGKSPLEVHVPVSGNKRNSLGHKSSMSHSQKFDAGQGRDRARAGE